MADSLIYSVSGIEIASVAFANAGDAHWLQMDGQPRARSAREGHSRASCEGALRVRGGHRLHVRRSCVRQGRHFGARHRHAAARVAPFVEAAGCASRADSRGSTRLPLRHVRESHCTCKITKVTVLLTGDRRQSIVILLN